MTYDELAKKDAGPQNNWGGSRHAQELNLAYDKIDAELPSLPHTYLMTASLKSDKQLMFTALRPLVRTSLMMNNHHYFAMSPDLLDMLTYVFVQNYADD